MGSFECRCVVVESKQRKVDSQKEKKKGRRYNIVVFWDVGFVYS